jgi:hypothetical protein
MPLSIVYIYSVTSFAIGWLHRQWLACSGWPLAGSSFCCLPVDFGQRVQSRYTQSAANPLFLRWHTACSCPPYNDE